MMSMINALRDHCRKLLTEQTVQVIIGYGASGPERPAPPVFVTRPEDVEQLTWNTRCVANLTVYLTRKEIRALGKPAIVVKGCDARTLIVLEQENQIERGQYVSIGLACAGVGAPPAAKCAVCEVRRPRGTDAVLGETEQPAVAPEARYAELEAFLRRPPTERLAYWKRELARCVKCYACRQVCPLCYCERCIADKNRPTCLAPSATLKGNFAWQITRAFHQAARCVGCDACTRACPVGIDLRLLQQSLARAADTQFGYRPGLEREATPVVGAYSTRDKDTFIR